METLKTLTFQGFGLTIILKMGEVYESVFDDPRKEAVADGKQKRCCWSRDVWTFGLTRLFHAFVTQRQAK